MTGVISVFRVVGAVVSVCMLYALGEGSTCRANSGSDKMNALSKVELWLNNDEMLYKRVNEIVTGAWETVQTSTRESGEPRRNECIFLIRDSLEEIMEEVYDNIVSQIDAYTMELVGSDILRAAIDDLDLAVLANRLLASREDDYIKEYGTL